jgi:acyl transferase domain-containing protein
MLFIGITFPSKDGQSTLMKEVYKRSEIKTDDIAFMEMHSTGTPVSLNILKGFQPKEKIITN